MSIFLDSFPHLIWDLNPTYAFLLCKKGHQILIASRATRGCNLLLRLLNTCAKLKRHQGKRKQIKQREFTVKQGITSSQTTKQVLENDENKRISASGT